MDRLGMGYNVDRLVMGYNVCFVLKHTCPVFAYFFYVLFTTDL